MNIIKMRPFAGIVSFKHLIMCQILIINSQNRLQNVFIIFGYHFPVDCFVIFSAKPCIQVPA